MFDQNDQNQQTQDITAAAPVAEPAFAAAAPVVDTPIVDTTSSVPTYNTTAFTETPQPVATDQFAAPVAETPVPATEPTATFEDPSPVATASEAPVVVDTPAVAAPAVADNSLLSIKQNALQSLTPLLSHLEQSPEEKFRTTMMMIQASDDQSLLQAAYDAANAITDEKTKAQALLDVVNEINYFTQAKSVGQQAQQTNS